MPQLPPGVTEQQVLDAIKYAVRLLAPHFTVFEDIYLQMWAGKSVPKAHRTAVRRILGDALA